MLENICTFRDREVPLTNLASEYISVFQLICAYCCVLHTASEVLSLKAYWLGQPEQGGSLKSSNKPPSDYYKTLINDIPEEHNVFRVLMFEWMMSVLRGHRHLVNSKFSMRHAIYNMALKICNSNSTKVIDSAKLEFIKYINQYLVDNKMKPLSIHP